MTPWLWAEQLSCKVPSLSAPVISHVPVVSLAVSLKPRKFDNENVVELSNDTTFIYNQDGANLHANLYNLIFLQNKNGDYSELKSNNGHYIHSFLYCHYNFLMLTNPLEELSRHDGSLLWKE